MAAEFGVSSGMSLSFERKHSCQNHVTTRLCHTKKTTYGKTLNLTVISGFSNSPHLHR